MNQITNFKELNKLNVSEVISYVLNDEMYEFEKEEIQKMNEFEEKFNKIFMKIKRDFYANRPLNINSKFRIEIKDWMLERLIALDLNDSLDKYFFLNIIDFHSKDL